MPETPSRTRQVLIVSANPLFREGLRKVYAERWQKKAVIAALPTTLQDAFAALEKHSPDLVIVDYDDKTINRDQFMNAFLSGETPMQVMLVSLQESGHVVVYDRKSLTPSQAEDWLTNPWKE